MSENHLLLNAENASRFYQLAVAKDAASLCDSDASLALSRAAIRTLMAISPDVAQIARGFVEEEIRRLSMECTEEGRAAIALVKNAAGLCALN